MKNKNTFLIVITLAILLFLGYNLYNSITNISNRAVATTKIYVDSLERKISELSVEITELRKTEALIKEDIEKNKSSVISIYNKYKYLQSQLTNTPIKIDITEEDSLILKRLQNSLE